MFYQYTNFFDFSFFIHLLLLPFFFFSYTFSFLFLFHFLIYICRETYTLASLVMPCTVVERYGQLCQKYGQKKIIEIEIQLEKDSSFIDASSVYLPRKHFMCICDLVKERSEITSLKLDNCPFTSADLTLLFESIRETRIKSLSLKNVKMSIQDGEQLKELCKLNPNITHVNLEDTCLPEILLATINLAVGLNKALIAERNITGNYAIQATKKDRRKATVNLWPRDLLQGVGTISACFEVHSLTNIMNEIITSECDYFTDQTFNYEPEYFSKHYSNVEWHRGRCVSHTPETVCAGISPVLQTEGWRNTNLCGALNVIQREDELKKNIFCQDMRDVGCFGFRFFGLGTPIEVLVDDFLPFTRKDGELVPLSLRSDSNDYFGPLIEKAIAKLFGGYSVLEKLSFVDYLSLLTGGLCFRKMWREFFPSNSSIIFTGLRDSILDKQKVIGIAMPKNSNDAAALIEKGLCPKLPYTIISTDICKRDGVMEYIVQVIGPMTSRPFKEAFNWGCYRETEYVGFPVFWMRFEHFLIYLEDVFSIKWTYSEHLGKMANSIQKIDTTIEWTSTSAHFASNPAFHIECTEKTKSPILLYIECNEENAKIAKQLHFFPLVDKERRYDISPKNEINYSDKITGKTGGVLYEMKPGEKLQVVLSADACTSCTLNAISLHSFKLSKLPERLCKQYIKGEWNFFYEGRRVPDMLYSVKNSTSKNQRNFVFSLAQRVTDQQPYGVSMLLWTSGTARDVKLFETADIETEIVCDLPAVFTIRTDVVPGGEIVFLPCRHDEKCPPDFELVVYSEGSLTVETTKIPLPLFSD